MTRLARLFGPIFRSVVLSVLALRIASPVSSAAEPELRPEDLPHFPPVEPSEALATFDLRPGFHLELAASEPEVMDPIALVFDERGRAYVLEMRDYSERRPERLGRVRRLEDRDGDGRFETSRVFLDGLPWPTAITYWNDGIIVGATPDILYAKDTDGDGQADVREVLFTGFASDYAPYETNRLNVQAMLNSFQWGPDNRIHGSSGLIGGKVRLVDSPFTRTWRTTSAARNPVPTPVGDPAKIVDLRGRDFSFDPWTLELRTETGGGQYGMSFDDEGRKFLCSNSDHLQIVNYEDRHGARNPWYSLPPARSSIAVDGPAAEVFRISPEEPWRVIRTRWRVTGLVQGIIEGGGRASGYFTSATGLTIYRGDAYGPDYVGDAFVADCGSNLIHRKKLRTRGCETVGERPEEERKREFLACRDTWFRPVQFANAPDGCLWMIDMYREIIEHPWSLPPNLKRLLDLNAGNDRGRLYRIVPDGMTPRRGVNLADLSPEALVRTLEHPNAWHRETAARLLCERRDDRAIGLLRDLSRNSPKPLARLHALATLQSLMGIQESDLRIALNDASPAVRGSAVRSVGRGFAGQELPSALAEAFAARIGDEAPVRLELAFALGEIRHPRRIDWLSTLIRTTRPDAGESLVTEAALSSAGKDAGEVLIALAREEPVAPGSSPAMASLAAMVGRRHDGDSVRRLRQWIAARANEPWALGVTAGLADGLRQAGASLLTAGEVGDLKPVFDRARSVAAGETRTPGDDRTRLESIRLLGLLPADDARGILTGVLDPVPGGTARAAASPEVQRAAFEVLLRGDERRAPDILFARWKTLPAITREPALDLVLRRPEGPTRVLAAIADQRVASRDLTLAQLSSLRSHADAAVRARALELLGTPPASRHEAIAASLAVLELKGDAERGKAVHQTQCATCHRLGGEGQALGPDFESVRSQPKEKLLVAIIDPNREVQPTYLATTVDTTDGESVTGLLSDDTAAGMTLKQAAGVVTHIPRNRIAAVKAEGRSIMPEGFEATLTPQQMADLLALLTGTP